MTSFETLREERQRREYQFLESLNILQTFAFKHGIELELPEIVCIGDQSAGKSSLIQGLANFQFNHVKSTIGTRRPMILQLIRDESKLEPFWTVEGEDAHANKHYNTQQIMDIIRDKNNIEDISPHEFIVTCRYCKCFNITIVDMPGLRFLEQTVQDRALKQQIEQVVKKRISKPNAIILVVEKANENVANCKSLEFALSAHPDNKYKTIVAFNKFDIQVDYWRKAHAETGDIIQYFNRENDSVIETEDFFTSMPIIKDGILLSLEDYDYEMQKIQSEHLHYLNEKRIPEQFMCKYGMENLANHLVDVLFSFFEKSVHKFGRIIRSNISNKSMMLTTVKDQLKLNGKREVRYAMLNEAQQLSARMSHLIRGLPDNDSSGFCLTLKQENEALDTKYEYNLCECVNDVIPNHMVGLHAGPALNRFSVEIEFILRSLAQPAITTEDLERVRGTDTNTNTGISWVDAANKLLYQKSLFQLEHVLNIIESKALFLFIRIFEPALSSLKEKAVMLNTNSKFRRVLSVKYEHFIREGVTRFITATKKHFEILMHTLSLDDINEVPQDSDPIPTKQNILSMIKAEMGLTGPNKSTVDAHSKFLTKEVFEYCKSIITKHFHRVRRRMASDAVFMLSFHIKNPIFEELVFRLTQMTEDEEGDITAGIDEVIANLQKQEKQLQLEIEENEAQQIRLDSLQFH